MHLASLLFTDLQYGKLQSLKVIVASVVFVCALCGFCSANEPVSQGFDICSIEVKKTK